jgi:hypothetical protein
MKRFVAGLMLVTVTAVPVFADTPPPLKVKRDTPLRLYPSDGGRLIEGRLKDADDRSITVDTGNGRSQRFSREQIRTVMYRTPGRDREKGAVIGAAITGLAGAVACIVAMNNEPGTVDPIAAGVCGVAAALPGMAIGFAIGTTGGEWHGVAPAGFTVAGAAAPRRATAALTVRFGR